uniref:Tyrosine-protein phosphatase domain-containing protein n=1 Tax=Rhabditophanes sp. KR3021 TaxID=114890 RepID=A0AC35U140_9BILA
NCHTKCPQQNEIELIVISSDSDDQKQDSRSKPKNILKRSSKTATSSSIPEPKESKNVPLDNLSPKLDVDVNFNQKNVERNTVEKRITPVICYLKETSGPCGIVMYCIGKTHQFSTILSALILSPNVKDNQKVDFVRTFTKHICHVRKNWKEMRDVVVKNHEMYINCSALVIQLIIRTESQYVKKVTAMDCDMQRLWKNEDANILFEPTINTKALDQRTKLYGTSSSKY